jgi:hypothetical protein
MNGKKKQICVPCKWNVATSKYYLKVPKCEIFDPFFFTPINPIWVGGLRTGEKKKIFEDHGRYSPFCFFSQAEPALKICLRRLNLRLKIAYAG